MLRLLVVRGTLVLFPYAHMPVRDAEMDSHFNGSGSSNLAHEEMQRKAMVNLQARVVFKGQAAELAGFQVLRFSEDVCSTHSNPPVP